MVIVSIHPDSSFAVLWTFLSVYSVVLGFEMTASADYESLLHTRKEDKYKDFYRYRLSACYYFTVLVIVIFLILNFLNYNPEVPFSTGPQDFKPSENVLTEQKSEELPLTTTPSAPTTPYNYSALPLCDLSTPIKQKAIDPKEVMHQFFRCASMILMRFARNPEGMLFNWPYTIYVCDEEEELTKIPLKSLDNGEKQYWAVLPKCRENSTFVNFGTGSNTKAEEDLQKIVQNITTFGTDPFLSDNKNYHNFYNAAISNSSKQLELTMENGEAKNVSTIDEAKFFNETLAGVKKIDMLWINPNAGNFEYWKYLNKDGVFDQMGIKVCQLNIEILKKDAVHWEKFITPLVSETKYIFMRPMATKGGNVTRTFFLNALDPECTRKYLEQ